MFQWWEFELEDDTEAASRSHFVFTNDTPSIFTFRLGDFLMNLSFWLRWRRKLAFQPKWNGSWAEFLQQLYQRRIVAQVVSRSRLRKKKQTRKINISRRINFHRRKVFFLLSFEKMRRGVEEKIEQLQKWWKSFLLCSCREIFATSNTNSLSEKWNNKRSAKKRRAIWTFFFLRCGAVMRRKICSSSFFFFHSSGTRKKKNFCRKAKTRQNGMLEKKR